MVRPISPLYSGQAPHYTDWNAGEPNNHNSYSGGHHIGEVRPLAVPALVSHLSRLLPFAGLRGHVGFTQMERFPVRLPHALHLPGRRAAVSALTASLTAVAA